MRQLALFFTSLLFLLGSGASAAGALQVTCDPVVDQAAASDTGAILAAINELSLDATYVVRVFESSPDGDINLAAQEVIDACFSGGVDGIQDNLVLIGVSMTEQTSIISFGGDHYTWLNPQVESIRKDVLGSELRSGNVTGGVIAALQEIDRQLVLAQAAPTATTVPTSAADDAAVASGSGAGGESSSGGVNIGLLLVGVTAVGAAVGGIGYASSRRQLNHSRQVFSDRQQLLVTRAGAAQERSYRLSAESDLWRQTTAGQTSEVLEKLIASHDREYDETTRTANELLAAVPKGAGAASKSQLAHGTERMTQHEQQLTSLTAIANRLTAFGRHVSKLAVTMPTKIALIVDEIAEALELAATRTAEGWKVDEATARLASARDQVKAVDLTPLALDTLTLSEIVEGAEASTFEATHDIQTVVDRPLHLAEWGARLVEAVQAERKRVDHVRGELEKIRLIHAEESWSWVSDHPAAAERGLERSESLRAQGLGDPIAQQDWVEAARLLEASGMELIGVDGILDDFDDLAMELNQALHEAPELVSIGAQRVQNLEAFIQRHDADLGARFDTEPERIEAALLDSASELRRPTPNFLRVAANTELTVRAIDALLVDAQEEHERMEALRSQLSTERARARRSIDNARRAIGWELFKSKSGRSLDEIEIELSDLSGPLENQVDQAAAIADEALAIRHEIVARRRRQSTWIMVGGGSGGGSRGGGGFSGGSFGGGGGGSFGGGSSSGSW